MALSSPAYNIFLVFYSIVFITTWKLFINRETDQNIHKFLGRSLWPSKRTRNDKVIPTMLNGRRWISLQHRFNVIEHYYADMNLLPPEMTNEFLHWFNYAPLPRPHSNVKHVLDSRWFGFCSVYKTVLKFFVRINNVNTMNPIKCVQISTLYCFISVTLLA